MLTGLICIVLGLWILRRVFRSKPSVTSSQVYYYETQLKLRETLIKQLENKLREKNENRDLDAKILADAINRETRAKGALAAVLLKAQATPEQVDEVLRHVEASEGAIDGD